MEERVMIWATRRWPPGCGRSPPRKLSSPCGLTHRSAVSATSDEPEGGEIAPETIPLESEALVNRSISAVHQWPPACSRSPRPKLSLPHCLPQPVDAGGTLYELGEGEITPRELEGKNSYSAQVVGGGATPRELVEGEITPMESRVHRPPKRKPVQAIQPYRRICGQNIRKEGDVLGEDGETVLDGEGGTNKKSRKNCEAWLTCTRKINMHRPASDAGFGHMVDKHSNRERFKGKTMYLETHPLLVKGLDREKKKDRDPSHCAVAKDVKRVPLQEKTEVLCVEDDAKVDRVKERKGVDIHNYSTADIARKKVAKPIKIRFNEKKEEASKVAVAISKSPSERANPETCRVNRLAMKKSCMKLASKLLAGITRPTRNYNPNFPSIDRSTIGDADLEYASSAIPQSRNCLSRMPAKKSVSPLYNPNLINTKHNKGVANKSKLRQPASSSGLDVFQCNTTYFGPKKSNRSTDPRAKVKRCQHLFKIISEDLLEEVESGKKLADMERNRIDLRTARILQELNETLNGDKPVVGSVPGIEVGDEYRYRALLFVLGLHRPLQGGIDSTVRNGLRIATSIVVSGGYSDNFVSPDLLIYTGSGGKPTGKPGHTNPEDQKLVRGNLALKNSMEQKTPVRVIHGSNTHDRNKVVMTFTYVGLYMVEKMYRHRETYFVDRKPKSAMVFKFWLRRLPGQPELNWNRLIKVQKSKVREGFY